MQEKTEKTRKKSCKCPNKTVKYRYTETLRKGKEVKNMALGDKKIIANNIQFYLDKNAKSVADMISDLDLKSTTVYDWVNARTYPRIDKIELMANYFHITKSDLIEERRRESNPLTQNTSTQPSIENAELDLDKALAEKGLVMKFNGKELSDKAKKGLLNVLEMWEEE